MQKTKLGSKKNQDESKEQKKKLTLSSLYGEVGFEPEGV